MNIVHNDGTANNNGKYPKTLIFQSSKLSRKRKHKFTGLHVTRLTSYFYHF